MRFTMSFLGLTALYYLLSGVTHAQTPGGKMLKHVVTVTFKPGAPASVISAVDQSFKNLAKLKMVKAYEWGISPVDARNKDTKHVYVSTFASDKDLASYGASPEHQKHIKLGASSIKGVQASDYWVEK